MAQPALPPHAPAQLAPDSIIVLHGATWADYQRVLDLKGDSGVPRVAYLEGVLELMSPSPIHESIKSMLGCLIEAWCMEKGVDITPYGSWTHESKENQRGVEPDECYVLGDSPEPERCDLAIEVVWTSSSLDKLEIYKKLGVREAEQRAAPFRLSATSIPNRYWTPRPMFGSMAACRCAFSTKKNARPSPEQAESRQQLSRQWVASFIPV